MKKETVLGMLALLLIGVLTSAVNIQAVKASRTIYTRADGSIDPPTAPTSNLGNVTVYSSVTFYDPFDVWNYSGAWTYFDPDAAEGYVSVSDGMLHVTGYGPPYQEGGLTTIREFDYPITAEIEFRSNSADHSPSLRLAPQWTQGYITIQYDVYVGGWHVNYFDTTGDYDVVWGGSISAVTWYTLKLVVTETNFKVYLDDILKVDRDWSPPAEYSKTISLATTYGSGGSGDFDWVNIGAQEVPAGVSIEAYCYTEAAPVSISITMDGSPTAYTTPHTFTDLTGIHTFTVPDNDPSSHPFKQWSTGETSTTITVDANGTYTAYYGSGLSDVAVIEVVPSKAAIGQGYIAPIMVTVENQGSSSEMFNVTAYYGGTAILTERWPEGVSSNIFWSMGDALRDGYIDLLDYYLMASQFGWIGPPGKNPADINSDGKVNLADLSLCSKNYGKNIWATLGLPKLIEDHATVTLPSGYVALIGFRWNTTGVIKGSYTISAYAWPVPGEIDTTDNSLVDGIVYVGIPGDVVPDYGSVDVKDVYAVARAYGTSLEGPNPPGRTYNPNCDINGDNSVDVKDYYIVCQNYGKTDP